MKTVQRLAKHVQAENKALVGYPYASRKTEQQWALANLPPDAGAFRRVVDAVQADWARASDLTVAELLLGTSSFVHDASDTLMLRKVAEECLAAVRTWGVPIGDDPRTWPTSEKSHACIECGAPATYRASAGWACEKHCDELS